MAKVPQKIVLAGARDIPFDRLSLSQSNVRRVKAGVSINALADDIVRRTLLQSLNVRPILDREGAETGRFEVPAGGRRFRALELLVKQKRLAKNAPIPCVVKPANGHVLAEEDSYAENTFREPLHPLDQFTGMQAMVDKGEGIESIAAHFFVTPAVVNQRLRLAKVAPSLREIYAADGMTLEQLMAFSVSQDHAHQEQVWELVSHSFNKSGQFIRDRLTEDAVRVTDKRVRFIGIDAYIAAGGTEAMRDLFQPDDGGWLTDPALLDRLVAEKLRAAGEAIGAEGWKWVATAVDMPWGVTNEMRELDDLETPMTQQQAETVHKLQAEADALESEWMDADDVPDEVHAKLTALDEEIAMIVDRPKSFAREDIARSGAFVSIERDGSLCIERGYVRPEDEAAVGSHGAPDGDGGDGGVSKGRDDEATDHSPKFTVVPIGAAPGGDDDEDGAVVKPLPDRLVAELTAWRTLALQDAFAQHPSTAFAAVLHAFVLACFYHASRESCLDLSPRKVSFGLAPAGLGDSAPAKALAERHRRWADRLPDSEKDVWDALLRLDSTEQAALFAHCASNAVNAQQVVAPKYDNGQLSAHVVERRIAHSHILARAVGLDLIGAGWRATVPDYFTGVTKPRIIADVAEAKGPRFAEMIAHLKKADMAREAERFLDDSDWLPAPMRTPPLPDSVATDGVRSGEDSLSRSALLEDEQVIDTGEDGDFAVAAE